MAVHPHHERHFTAGDTVRDVVIGMADGLTVPFALAAALSGAIAHTDLIITAGLAEIVGGAIAMGLGGFLAALAVVGGVKGRFTGVPWLRGALQTTLVGGLAASAAFAIARAIG